MSNQKLTHPYVKSITSPFLHAFKLQNTLF